MDRDSSLKVALISLGCPKNLVDSERMLAILAEAGCVVAAPMDEADVIVVNTCGFLSSARRESLEFIDEAIACKRRGPARRVVVAGCLVNRDAERLYELRPEIDAIVGVDNRHEILSAVVGKRRVSKVDTHPAGRGSLLFNPKSAIRNLSDAGRFRLTPPHTAYLRISKGCSQRCTFCTIPAIRGPFRSKPPETVIAEARELIADGCLELNVIAQDTTRYGADFAGAGKDHGKPSVGFEGQWNLARLLRELDKLDGVRWIRLMYAYPDRITDELIDCIGECERVVPYLDVPLQHVVGPILKRMGRGMARGRIEALLARLRERIPGLAIRTTFIVGFPGETDAQFGELLDFVRAFRFDALGVFAFSPEEGTPAAAMDDQAPEDVKAERVEAVMLAQQEIAFDANARRVGERLDVLVDGLDEHGMCVGRHPGQAPEIDGICYLTEPQPAGKIVPAIVVDWDEYDLIVKAGED